MAEKCSLANFILLSAIANKPLRCNQVNINNINININNINNINKIVNTINWEMQQMN